MQDEDGNEQVISKKPDSDSGGIKTNATTASISESNGTTVAVLVSGPGQFNRGPLPSGASATIWVGAYDDSGTIPAGLANKTLDIAITRPDGATESFSTTTNSQGGGSINYDLSQSTRNTGVYDITVSDQNDVRTSTQVSVGVDVISTSGRGGENIFVGEESTFAFFAHDGDEGTSNIDLTLRILRNGSKLTETIKTTESDGFATISFTPSQMGDYRIEAERNGSVLATEYVQAVDMIAAGDYDLRSALIGATNAYGGYLYTSNGPKANTDIVVSIYSDYSQNNLVAEQSATTDEHGFFFMEYGLPSDYSGEDLNAEAQTANGETIPLEYDWLPVNNPSDGGGETSTVQLSANTSYQHAPGQTVSVDIEATDDGNAIGGQTVEVFLRFGYDGPPVYSSTVTTDSNGTATISTSLPNNAPDGFDLEGTIGMQYNGTTYTDSVSTDIVQYDFDFDVPNAAPGESGTYSISVTDVETGDPAGGVPYHFDAVYADGQAGTFGTAKMVSGSDGTDSATIQIPSDVGFRTLANNLSRYDSDSVAWILYPNHPGTLSTSDTLVAGETTEFSFDVPSGANLTGMAFSETSYPKEKSFGTQFQGQGTFNIALPSEFSTGDSFSLTVWAVDDQGSIYRDRQHFTIDDEATTTFSIEASGETGIPSGGEGTISISANQIDEISIEKLWLDWTLTATNPDGGTISDSIANSGNLTISYGSRQNSTSPSITLSLPGRYIGGEYQFKIIGTNSDGQTGTTTATFIIG
ncbi:hypothetical protein HZS55_06305 [Halosimplex rubrum]|uniref:Uncharacterized protein n=1 Tax=Halosimplex rubrum TaxID=869889 RepID=A0A7D5T4G0_9EURY|nr:hypothetical protein [Halosimplex rubrum]QLH76929.1 hypothetical protein HZS55_06305 [Halosimplex rubrum]